MEETPQQQERIERYLRGELPEAERERFAAELARDPALRRRVALHQDLEAGFANPEEERLRATLRSVAADFRTRRTWLGAWRHNRKRWAIAASLLLLIAAAIFWLVPNTDPDPAYLAVAAFDPYPIHVFRSSDAAVTPPTDILEAYQSRQFDLAAERIADLPESEASAYWSFYRAVALIGAERGGEAVPLLRELRADQTLPGLNEAIEWYLALALLQANEPGPATELLRAIADSTTHYQRAAASRLLSRL